MRNLRLTATFALLLSACATTGDFGPVDTDGFAAQRDQALYHVATGLYCPSALGDMLRDKVVVYRKDIDVSCNYQRPGEELTAYLYPDSQPVDQALAGTIDAATRGNLANMIEPSEALTETCQTTAMSMSILQSMLGATESDDRTIEIDTNGGMAGFPFRVAGLEGNGLRSYIALVPRSGGQMLKLRYSTRGAATDAARERECRALYGHTKQLHDSIGKPNGAPESDDAAALGSILSEIDEQET